MKRFCSQCGKELERNILICPKCGFKNKKKKNNKRLIIPIVILVILIIVVGTTYIFKDRLGSVIESPLDLIAQLQDPDYSSKKEFKKSYEKYLIEVAIFNTSIGYPVDEENSDKLNISDLYSKRRNLLEDVEKGNCYEKFSSDDLCDSIREEIFTISLEIRNQLSENNSQFSTCCTEYDPFPEICEEKPICALETYRNQCPNCEDLLQNLLTYASSISDPTLAENLIFLTSTLKEYNELSAQLINAIREESYYNVLIDKNLSEKEVAETKSESEIKNIYDNYDEFSKFLFFDDGAITKAKLLNQYDEYYGNLINGRMKETEKHIAIQTSKTELIDEIKDIVSIINGSHKLDLSLPN